jgi:hypothetical protein
MLKARLLVPALAGALLMLGATTAFAAPPPPLGQATVTVRVEGLNETKQLPTLLTTSETPVVKDGNPAHACSGYSALGALQIATSGNWSGPWESGFGQYTIFSIEGETHEFEPSSNANYFWAYWVNGTESEAGACIAQINSGDRLLFFPSCFGSACPAPEPLPLEAEAPATANVGEGVRVTVKRYSKAGVGSELAGARIVGGGTEAITDSHGSATLSFAHAGEALLGISAPGSIRTEARICVHAGNDGTCGTSVPVLSPLPLTVKAPQPAKPYIGPYAVIAQVASVLDQHVYTRRSAPRVLSGSVAAHVGVTSVSLALRRRNRGRCYSYNAVRERFARSRCAATAFFGVSNGSSFSYLLPTALPRGAYVLDVKATDSAGNVTTPTYGKSRIRFYVH